VDVGTIGVGDGVERSGTRALRMMAASVGLGEGCRAGHSSGATAGGGSRGSAVGVEGNERGERM
jgi:hypothetical protein